MLGRDSGPGRDGIVGFCQSCGQQLSTADHWYNICGFGAPFCTVCTLERVVEAADADFKLEYDFMSYEDKVNYVS